MKSRNIIAVLCALVGFALCQQAQAQDTPDPGSVGGSLNTADGTSALTHVATGAANAAFGWFSLFSNTDGSFNTAVGAATLVLNVGNQGTGEGIENTAVGAAALLLNTTGSFNNAVGVSALLHNDSGGDNNAHGREALNSNINGDQNNAFGDSAMIANVSGSFNTGMGDDALIQCIDGSSNVAVGDEAGTGIVHGSNIIAIGAGVSGVSTAFGEVDDSCYIGNIQNRVVTFSSMHPVLVDDDGKLGTTTVDANGNKIVPVVETAEHQAMLNHKIEELRATVALQQKQIDTLTAGLQKVNAQLEVSRPAAKVVLSNP